MKDLTTEDTTERRGRREVEQPKVGPEGARLAGASESKDTERATPETDAAVTTFTSISKLKKRFECSTGKVSADFARRMERERDEAREDATNYYARIGELEKERDEAREEAAHWKTEYEIVVDRLRGRKHPRDNGIIADDEIIPKLERERDEVRDELCHLRACVFDVMSALDAGAFTELRKAWEEGAK